MVVALFFIVGDHLARAPRAREVLVVLWCAVFFSTSLFLPSPWADLVTALVVFSGSMAASWWSIKGRIMRRRFAAAVVAWEMGFDSRAAWKWSREFMGSDT